jgi:RNA polymerase sigma-70 factor (ECF subfamily)
MVRDLALSRRRDPLTNGSVDAAHTERSREVTDAAVDVDFDELYRHEFTRIAALVHSLVGRRDVAEEITQDAFVITHDRWRRISGYAQPADFVRRVAINRAMSWLRRRSAERRALKRLTGRPASKADRDELDHPLWIEVRRLPARQAQAIALTYVDDLPVERIAAVLGCSVNTVKTHLKRGRAALAASFHQCEAPMNDDKDQDR